MTSARIEIREARTEDQEGLKNASAEAHNFLRRFYQKVPTTIRAVSDVPFTRLAIVLDGKVVGTATYEIRGNSLYFGSLGVLENFRRNGIAHQLISFLKMKAKELGLSSLSCETILETGNPAIFQRLGFSPASTTISSEFSSLQGDSVHEVLMEMSVTAEQ